MSFWMNIILGKDREKIVGMFLFRQDYDAVLGAWLGAGVSG